MLKMYLYLLFLVLVVQGFNYSQPIVINLDIKEFPLIYDQNLQLLFVGHDQKVCVYNLDGKLINSVILNVTLYQMAITQKPSLLITTKVNNDLHEFDFAGRYLRTISICGYNYRNLLYNAKYGYYLIHDLGWIDNLYSFSEQNHLINQTLIDSAYVFGNSYDVGEFTGNILVGSSNILTINDQKINQLTQIHLHPSDSYGIQGSFEIDETVVCIIYDKFYS